jgi:Vanillate O-demethylase oxygenase C-terminal domain
MHLLTPETQHSTRYFITHSRDERLDDVVPTANMVNGAMRTFSEDKFVLALQQRALLERGDSRVPNMTITFDAGPIQGRRLLDAAVQRERLESRSVVAAFSLPYALDRPG